MKKIILLITISLTSLSSFALPQYAFETIFYSEKGNSIVGELAYMCGREIHTIGDVSNIANSERKNWIMCSQMFPTTFDQLSACFDNPVQEISGCIDGVFSDPFLPWQE